jgi:hypothetical protein
VVYLNSDTLQCRDVYNTERMAHYNNLNGFQGGSPGSVISMFICYSKRVMAYGELDVYAPVKSEVKKW